VNRLFIVGVSLRTRLTVWYGALLALTLLAFSTLLYFTLQQSLASSMDTRLELRADQIRREVGASIGGLGLQPEDIAPGKLESTLGEFVEPGIYVQLLSSKGAVLAAPPNLVGGELPVPAASRQAITEDRRIFVTIPVASGDAQVRLLTEPIHENGGDAIVGAVQVAESMTPLESTMNAVERLLLSAGAAALALAMVIGWLLTRAALRPVAQITETARHIAATGDYSRRLEIAPPRLGRGDELFFLTATFNDMIERLEHLLESQKRLLADTSHELRNPITIIRGNLALLRRPNAPESSRTEAIVEAEEEAARMGRLVGDLLLLARADAGEPTTLQREPVDLAELVGEVVDRARPQADTRPISLTVQGRPMVLGDRDRLKQLLSNLVENAVRYTPRTGRIDVSVTDDAGLKQTTRAGRSRNARDSGTAPDMAIVSVADSGIGISPVDLPHVFERFYRADRARSRALGGSGLGLSIARYIVQAHGGTIEVASDGINRGATFTVRLPPLREPELDQPADTGSQPPTARTPGRAPQPIGR
jgi:signal transduction histidine kinase